MSESDLEKEVAAPLDLNEKPIQVLHVDDEPGFLKVAKECLESQGHFQVDTSTSVADALEKTKKRRYDVVVSDYQMPEKDGLQLLTELRKGGESIPFIMFTGRGREEVAIKALNLGADQYLNKLGDPETVFAELAHSIIRSVERRKAVDRIRESEEKFRKIFENARDGIVYLDKRGVILDVNRKAADIFGGPKNALIGKHFAKIGVLHLGDVPRVLRAFADGIAGKSVSLKVRINNRGGQGFVVEGSVSRAMVNDELVTMVIVRDVTERTHAEEALSASEEKYRALVENSLQGIVIVQDFHIVFTNQAFAEISGYTVRELLSLPPTMVKGLIHPDDQQLVWGRFSDRLAGKSVEPRYEYRGVRKDGTTCWVEMFAGRVEFNGKPAILGTVVDVTDLKKAEQAVWETQLDPDIVIKYSPEAAVYLDASLGILAINPRFSQVFGYSADEVKGKHIDDVVVPRNMMEEAERLNRDARDGYASFYTVRQRKDGSLLPVSISAAPVVVQGRLQGHVWSYKDISDLERAQNELEESRAHFQMLFNLMADPVAIVDERGKILEITQKVEEITGFKKDELIGKNFLRTSIATAKTKAIMIKNLAKRMLGGHVGPYEVEMLTRDKRKLLYEINAEKIEYKGKPADLVVFRDVLERKKLEEKLRVVGGLTRHDVRNKLSTVTGNIYLLKRKLAGDSEALERLSDIDEAVRQMGRIFEFARTYEKLGVEKLTWLDVGKAVDEAVSLFSDLKDVKVVNECRGVTVLADSLLRQIFYNLIDNSLKYGEKIQNIKVGFRKSGEDELELVYEDDGVGIPNNIRKCLFKEGAGKGTGYGLFMIRRICEVYGWRITESGHPHKGVRFVIIIPMAATLPTFVPPVDSRQEPQLIDNEYTWQTRTSARA